MPSCWSRPRDRALQSANATAPFGPGGLDILSLATGFGSGSRVTDASQRSGALVPAEDIAPGAAVTHGPPPLVRDPPGGLPDVAYAAIEVRGHPGEPQHLGIARG